MTDACDHPSVTVTGSVDTMGEVRVLIAPDSFGDTLTAVQAAKAIGAGWLRRSPDDEIELAPMSDGGPGFVDVLHASLGGELLSVTVTSLYGEATPTALLVVDDTAYVESAQACGLHLSARRDPELATSYGVGQMVAAALDNGARRIVVGLGGSGTNDGGAGLLAALGAVAEPAGALVGGPLALERLSAISVGSARQGTADVELVVASDVDNPLLGLRGATNVYGPQKGVGENRKHYVDAQLERLADLVDRRLADRSGAGAAGGLGFALLALGGSAVGGVDLVAGAVGLERKAASSDIVVTGEGAFDFSSRSGKVPYGVARVAAQSLRPCIALAGQVLVGSREMRTLGIESAYSMVDLVGREASFGEPMESLALLAERVARTWSR